MSVQIDTVQRAASMRARRGVIGSRHVPQRTHGHTQAARGGFTAGSRRDLRRARRVRLRAAPTGGPPRRRVEAGTLHKLLTRNAALRDVFRSEPELAGRLEKLQDWQSQRLLRTHKDLHADPRYRAAVGFFTDELYGSGDPRARDRDLLKVERMMERLLPPDALAALCLAIELEVLSQELDAELVRELPDGAITDEVYSEAYRRIGRRGDRERQIDLMFQIGKYLDGVVRKPIVRALVHLACAPAHAAGFGGLQDFLERGLSAFERIGGADGFLAAIRDRERQAMDALFALDEPPERKASGNAAGSDA